LNSSISASSWVVYFLYGAGFLLVLFSEPTGVMLVTRPQRGGSMWSPNEAARAAEVLRWLGAMLLATGMVERVVEIIIRLRSGNEK
jgi:hypothetical protein